MSETNIKYFINSLTSTKTVYIGLAQGIRRQLRNWKVPGSNLHVCKIHFNVFFVFLSCSSCMNNIKYLYNNNNINNNKLIKEKTWTVHSSCKLPLEPKARVANTRCGLADFTPVERILFFLTPRPKMTHFRFAPGGNGVLSARCEEK